MKKRTKESKKRINSLILLIAFTMILMITSTYAWFSTQKDILLSNIEGTVNVAEGLEVSIDGKTWANEIKLTSEILKGLKNSHVPEELTPVSTSGENTEENTEIQMMAGTVKKAPNDDIADKQKRTTMLGLEKITATTALGGVGTLEYPGYIAFDMYLRNSTRDKKTPTILQLNTNSAVTAGKSGTGLENSVRVGLAKFAGKLDVLTETINFDTAPQTFTQIEDFSIWEPNAHLHTSYVQNNNYVKGGVAKGQAIDTFGILNKAVTQEKDGTIKDIYQEDKTNNTNKKIVTLRRAATPESFIDDVSKVYNLPSISQEDGNKAFVIEPDGISKVRVYIWLEGGDPDCVNHASHGQKVIVNLGLIKDVQADKTGNQSCVVVPKQDLGQV